MHIPTIPKGFVLQVLQALEHVPEASESVAGDLLNQEKVSIADYIQLIQQLQQETQDEMLGLLERSVPIGSFAVLCNMLVHSPDVMSVLNNYSSFYGLFSVAGKFPLQVDQDDLLTLSINPNSKAAQHPYYVHTMLLGTIKLLCWLTGQRIQPEALNLTSEDHQFSSEYQYLFGVEPALGCRVNSVNFTPDVLKLAIAPKISVEEYTANRSTYLLIWAISEDLERKVYSMVADGIEQGHFSAPELADHLHISRHTLNRRLVAAGTTYREILSKVRKDQAARMLKVQNNSLEAVSDALGYSDVRAFSRAFRQWFGISPSAYRDG